MTTARTAWARRSRPVIAGVAGLAVLASLPSLPADGAAVGTAAPVTAAASATPTLPDDLVLVKHTTSLLAEHRWYVQVHEGHPVVNSYYGWHRDLASGDVSIDDGRIDVSDANTDQPQISARAATGEAAKSPVVSANAVGGRELMVLPEFAGTDQARLVWAVDSADGTGARTSYVDAVTGDVLKTVLVSKAGRGVGRVFDPNPVAKLQRITVRDHGDRASAVPMRAYSRKPLLRLKPGMDTLVGTWVQITNKDRPVRVKHRFFFKRDDDRFEQVSAYYAVDAAQSFLQSLGFKHVNAESQHVRVNAFPDDNSFYIPNQDKILLGSGGVDDAEDPEVVWHEYGHAVQDDQVPNFGITAKATAIGEAFGDYLAVTMSQRTYAGSKRVSLACVMDWDATAYSPKAPCLRRVDLNRDMDDYDAFDPHKSSQIYSRALWDINQGLGRRRATTVIVEANFQLTPRANFKEAADATVRVARRLYGDGAAEIARQAFVDRKILPEIE